MKASTKTLQNHLDLVPRTLVGRYMPAFGVACGNEILADLEQACDPDVFVGETGLVLLEDVLDYALPATVRNVKGLYPVAAGDCIPDRDHAYPHRVVGDSLRLLEAFTFSDDEDISGTVAASPPADLTAVYDTTAGKLDTLEDDELLGRLIRVTHASGVVEYRILKGNTPASFTADINGSLRAQAAAADAYLITPNFLIIEHNRYLTRLTAATETVDIPQDFEFLFRAGLAWKYNLQADQLSRETKTWGDTYADQLQNFRIDTTKARGTAIRNQPRSMPPLFE